MSTEIDNILLDFGNRLLDVANGKENPTMGELIETPKCQIENFYRNKIPEKRVHGSTHNPDYPLERNYGSPCYCNKDPYNQAIDTITAQFNSGGSDE